jgi:phospholipase/carboxylesterase
VPIANNSILKEEFDWAFRFKLPEKNPSRVLLLLHGWTGDERSMWQFTQNIPSDYAIIAPRAPYDTPLDKKGYSWREIKANTWGAPTLAELRFAADGLITLVDKWLVSVKIAPASLDVVGFSQGGALATTLASLHPERMRKVAILSGFIPAGGEALLSPNLLDDIHFFWAHGSEDDVISLERGLASVALLKDSGADLRLCKAKIGHRVSRECRYALNDFLNAA